MHTVYDPAPVRYVRSATISARYAGDKNHAELTRADLEKRHSVSPGHIDLASSQILSIVCKTVKSRHQRNKFKDKSGGSGVELFRWLNTEIARLIDEDAAEAIEAAITAFFTRAWPHCSYSQCIQSNCRSGRPME